MDVEGLRPQLIGIPNGEIPMRGRALWRVAFTKFEGYTTMCINCRQIIDKGIKFTFTRGSATIIKYLCEKCYRTSRNAAIQSGTTEEEYVESLLRL